MKVKFIPQDVEFEIKPNQSVMHVAQDHGLYIKSVCKGVPSCAECRVRVVEGDHNVLPPGSEELGLIGSGHFIDRRRLSCQLKCFGDIVVDLSEQVAKQQGLIGGRKTKKLVGKDDRIEDAYAIRASEGARPDLDEEEEEQQQQSSGSRPQRGDGQRRSGGEPRGDRGANGPRRDGGGQNQAQRSQNQGQRAQGADRGARGGGQQQQGQQGSRPQRSQKTSPGGPQAPQANAQPSRQQRSQSPRPSGQQQASPEGRNDQPQGALGEEAGAQKRRRRRRGRSKGGGGGGGEGTGGTPSGGTSGPSQ